MLEDKLKNYRENNPEHNAVKPSGNQQGNQILLEIKQNQDRKKATKMNRVLDPQGEEFAPAFIDLDQLKNLAWTGIPQNVPSQRAEAWRLLLDYVPPDKGFREETVSRKQQEYYEIITKYFGSFDPEDVTRKDQREGVI